MKLRIVAAVACCFSAITAHARLGETETELRARYPGPVFKAVHSVSSEGRRYELGPTFTFKQDDWTIKCDMVDGRCVRIDYGKRGSWTDDQMLAVLNANSQGGKWNDTSNPNLKKLERTWKRDDGAIAKWNALGFVITVPAYERAKEVAEAKGKAESRKVPKL